MSETLCISYMGDEGRPFGVGFQERASNHSKLLRSRAVVVSVGVKALGTNPEQVWIRETNASEPLLTRRDVENVVKTRGCSFLWDKSVGYLGTGQAAAGVQKA